RKRWWPVYAWGLERTDRILLQHRSQFDNLAPRWQEKARLLMGTVEIPPAVTPHSQRDRYIAWVGVLREPKRPDLLIEFARKLPEVRFVVCGGVSTHRTGPEYSKRIVEGLQSTPNIEYLGQVSPEKSLQIIRNAAILLSTSTMEGFPNVFLEAWAGGTPVVSTFLDPDDLIQKHGLGIAGKGTEETCTTLPGLIESVEWRQAIGDRTRQYAISHHSSEVVAVGLERAIAGDQELRLEARICRS
ncbi:MAG TPA: glycosyltransferase, partial [Acidobacteriota bacterium]|nr:glycosyltransferase [Acidobacteriota bacterium]